MMRTYVEFALKKFQNKMSYRLDFFMGILNTVITIVVYLCIYKALYGDMKEVDGITFSMVATHFVISLGLSAAFEYNEMFLQDKVHDGSITNEFLKPVNFIFRLLAENVGEGLFKVIFNFFPAILITMFYVKLSPPAGVMNVIVMLISVILGYMILWLMGFIVQTWSFWLFSVWGIMTIKNVIVKILSGTLLPLWFMPEAVRKVIEITPFESIYFTPIQIYLGEISGMELVKKMMIQVMWIGILWVIANVFWNRGTKKMIVQGG